MKAQTLGGGEEIPLKATIEGGLTQEFREAQLFTSSEALGASSNLVAAATGLRCMGFMLANTLTSLAHVKIRHGTLNGDPLIWTVRLNGLESGGDRAPDGIAVPDGVRIQVITGTVDVTIFHKTVT